MRAIAGRSMQKAAAPCGAMQGHAAPRRAAATWRHGRAPVAPASDVLSWHVSRKLLPDCSQARTKPVAGSWMQVAQAPVGPAATTANRSGTRSGVGRVATRASLTGTQYRVDAPDDGHVQPKPCTAHLVVGWHMPAHSHARRATPQAFVAGHPAPHLVPSRAPPLPARLPGRCAHAAARGAPRRRHAQRRRGRWRLLQAAPHGGGARVWCPAAGLAASGGGAAHACSGGLPAGGLGLAHARAQLRAWAAAALLRPHDLPSFCRSPLATNISAPPSRPCQCTCESQA